MVVPTAAPFRRMQQCGSLERSVTEAARPTVDTDAGGFGFDLLSPGTYDAGMSRRLPAVLAAAAALVAGCGGGVDRDSYVEKNLALLKTVPPFPGASLVKVDSAPYKGSDIPGARTIGYGTTRVYAVSAATPSTAVIAFYRRALRGAWRVLDVSAAPSVSLRSGDAYLHVFAGDGQVFVEIDHDCYKGGSSPRCFGP